MATHLANETTLLAKARVGNAESFGTLVDQYYRNIYGLALKITGNREDAEDVVQDAVLKAYTNLGQFRENSRFYTWLVRIAVNQALMKLRKRRTDREVPLGEVVAVEGESPVCRGREIEDWGNNPERLYAEIEFQEILGGALDGLSPRLSTAFVLRNVEDFSAEEMAEMLGLSVAAVKSRLVRARLKLRHRLSRFFQPALCPVAQECVPSGTKPGGRQPRKRRRALRLRPLSVVRLSCSPFIVSDGQPRGNATKSTLDSDSSRPRDIKGMEVSVVQSVV